MPGLLHPLGDRQRTQVTRIWAINQDTIERALREYYNLPLDDSVKIEWDISHRGFEGATITRTDIEHSFRKEPS